MLVVKSYAEEEDPFTGRRGTFDHPKAKFHPTSHGGTKQLPASRRMVSRARHPVTVGPCSTPSSHDI
ncbi:Inositol-pentakisphosphate 2-kinase [Musa troglodytarum]|uniref:Inositol-pentakisphosphate 2-kinase n=1 Tax=Musa troglodytarum TaxID=320322 RepID=A0A9E7HE51_9LILI|nr:Inositol-pentakisphosphate 2-kinase [Musa troglodytarum]